MSGFPRVGPSIFKPPGLSDVFVPGLDGGTNLPGLLGPIEFQWPRPLFVIGLLILPVTGLRTDLANLSLRIEDESFQDIFTDGVADHFVPALAQFGTTNLADAFSDLELTKVYPLQRPVAAKDIWRFTLQNVKPGVIAGQLAVELLLFINEGAAHE